MLTDVMMSVLFSTVVHNPRDTADVDAVHVRTGGREFVVISAKRTVVNPHAMLLLVLLTEGKAV